MAKKKEKVEEKVEIITSDISPTGFASVHNKDTMAKIRTYSKDEHGPDYRKLAQQFATKVGGVVL